MSGPQDDRPKNTGPRRGPKGGPSVDWDEHDHVDDYVDPAILREVEAELGLDPIEKAPPSPPHFDNVPQIASTRSVGRLLRLVLVTAVLIGVALYGWRATMNGRQPAEGTDPERRVPLPPVNRPVDPEIRQQARSLSDARRQLASSDIRGGISSLETLANENADTKYGADAMLLLAATHRYQKNEPERAIHWYRRFLDRHPRHADAPATVVRLAEYLVELGRDDEARDALDNYLKANPGETDHHRQARAMLERLGGGE